MRVSKHATKRIHERISIPKSSVDRMAKKAIEKGITHQEATGHLCKYMDKLFLSHKTASNIRIYNHKSFLFSSNMTLITVLELPNNLKKIADKLNERKKHNEVQGN